MTQRKLRLIFLLSFALNFIWENAHSFLYAAFLSGPITEPVLLGATFADTMYVTALGLLFIRVQSFRNRIWFSLPIGIVVAIVVELIALHSGLWAYKPSMPLVPFFHVGLTPAFQLGLLSYITYRYSLPKVAE
jgi:hypothetical protein